jgi:hypothetical protein
MLDKANTAELKKILDASSPQAILETLAFLMEVKEAGHYQRGDKVTEWFARGEKLDLGRYAKELNANNKDRWETWQRKSFPNLTAADLQPHLKRQEKKEGGK